MHQRVRRGSSQAKVALIIGAGLMGVLTYTIWSSAVRPAIAAAPTTPAPSLAMKETTMPSVTVRVINAQGQLSEPLSQPKVIKSEEEWKKQLTAEQYRITRYAGTERAFCGNLLDNKKEGVYTCVCCRLPLFASDSKFNSGTGWPSFFQPICKENVSEKADATHGMIRVEINCARCDAHLGHVFDDGPRPTGLRFCLNSESLDFTEKGELQKLAEK